jgi:cell division protein FtsL
VLDSLLQGRAWIPVLGLLLAGIVFFNVDLLRINREIAHTSDRASAVKRDNARLRTEVARLASSERVQEAARMKGLVLPEPKAVHYLTASPGRDFRRAAERAVPPAPRTPPPAPRIPSPLAGTPAAPTTTAPAIPTPAAPTTPTTPTPQAPAAAPTPAPAPSATAPQATAPAG